MQKLMQKLVYFSLRPMCHDTASLFWRWRNCFGEGTVRQPAHRQYMEGDCLMDADVSNDLV